MRQLGPTLLLRCGGKKSKRVHYRLPQLRMIDFTSVRRLRFSVSSLCWFTVSIALTVSLNAEAVGFEVASIKPTPSSLVETQWGPAPGGRFTAQGITAKQLIALAYGVRESQVVGGPKWIHQNRWNVEAKAANFSGTFNRQQLLEAAKSIVSERFQLRARTETREMAVYLLVVADGGHRLKATTEASPFMRVARGVLEGKSVTMDLLARTLSNTLDRAVINQTGVQGAYEVRLTWTPDPGLDGAPGGNPTDHDVSILGSIFTEIQNQLGLRLKADRGPGEVVEIEQVQLPGEN